MWSDSLKFTAPLNDLQLIKQCFIESLFPHLYINHHLSLKKNEPITQRNLKNPMKSYRECILILKRLSCLHGMFIQDGLELDLKPQKKCLHYRNKKYLQKRSNLNESDCENPSLVFFHQHPSVVVFHHYISITTQNKQCIGSLYSITISIRYPSD